NDVGWLRDDIAGEEYGVRDLVEIGESLFRVAGLVDRDGKRGEARFLLRLFLGSVFVETIGAQPRAIGELGGGLGGRQFRAVDLVDFHLRRAFAGAVELRHDATAGVLPGSCVERRRLA